MSVVSLNRPPPIWRVPREMASAIQPSTRSTSRGVISGPTSVSGKRRISHLQGLDPCRHPVDEFLLKRGVHVDALDRHADLPRVVVSTLDDRLDDFLEVGAAVDDEGSDATVLESAARTGGDD